MQHRPFPKIPTTLKDVRAGSAAWVATEKIHGAQLVIATDGRRVRFGKRKAWLEPDEPFFGWQMLRAELESRVRGIFSELGRGAELYLYGELFGGCYPHSAVTALPGLSAVQTGIWYSPTLHWTPFDGLLTGEAEPVFLAHDHLQRLAVGAGLPVPPQLGLGSRNELSTLPVCYASRVSAIFDLPDLEGNVAEGFVLKPSREMPADRRPLIKHKIPEFNDNRFDASRPFNAHAHLSVVELLQLSEPMLSPIRLASARSKVGEHTPSVVDEMVLDVCIDLEEMFPRRLGQLSTAEAEALHAALQALATAKAER